MDDIRRELGMSISQLASGIDDLADDIYYQLFFEMALLRVDTSDRLWIRKFMDYLEVVLTEIQCNIEEEA